MKMYRFLPAVLVIGSCAPPLAETNVRNQERFRQEVSTFSVKNASLGFKSVIGDAAEWAISEGENGYSDAMSGAYAGDVDSLRVAIGITMKLDWDAAGAVSHGSGLQMILAAVGDVTMAEVLSESRLQDKDRIKINSLIFPTFTNSSFRPMDLFPRTWKLIAD